MAEAENEGLDFFLSYAHLDNEPIDDDEEGWVTSFERALEVRLGQVLGRRPEIWWDQDASSLSGNSVLVAAISDGVSSSAVLIPVLSPGYKASAWCLKELESFCEAAERAGGVRVGKRSRIFKIVKTKIPLDEHPAQLRDLVGYKFFRLEKDSGRFRELSLSSSRQEYLQKIDDVAQDIQAFLTALERVAPPQEGAGEATPATAGSEPVAAAGPAVQAAAEPGKPVIYLAEATPDLAAEWERVRRTLRNWGHPVVPDRDLSSSGPVLRQEVRGYLEQAELAVHLLGEKRGSIPDEETESKSMIQNQIAAELAAQSGLRRLIWIPQTALEALDIGDLESVMRGVDAAPEPGADPAQVAAAAQRAFVRRLLTEEAAERGVELLHDSIEKLETRIEDRLAPQKKVKVEAASKAGGELRYVYMICDRRDEESAEAFKNELMDSEPDLEVFLPLFAGEDTADLEESDVRTYHKDSMLTSDSVVIYFGRAKEPWLKAKLGELRKSRVYARERPLRAKAVLLAPPAGPRKTPQRIRTREAEVIDCSGGLSVEALSGFLEKLRAEEAADD